MKPFLREIGKLFNNGQQKTDKLFYGVVKEKITANDNVTGYKVSLGGDSGTIDARKFAGAEVGDTVMLCKLANGSMIVLGRKDGDKDIIDVADDLHENYSNTEEVIELIGEYGGGSYQIVEYARSSSQTTAPTDGWSKTIPELTSTYKYLWVRIVEVDSEGEETIVSPPALSTALSGMYTFINEVRYDATTIDGGNIYTNNLVVNDGATIGNFSISGGALTGSGTTIDTNGISNTGSKGTVNISDGTVDADRLGCSKLYIDGCAIGNESGSNYIDVQGGVNCYSLYSSGNIEGGVLISNGNCRPSSTTGTHNLGTSTYLWSEVFAKKSTINTSDLNYKHDIKDIDDKYIAMLDDIQPVQYMYNDGDRVHTGYISQQVYEAMQKNNLTDIDFGGFCRDEDETQPDGYQYALRYAEFIALLHAKINKQQKQINDLTKRIEKLESEKE